MMGLVVAGLGLMMLVSRGVFRAKANPIAVYAMVWIVTILLHSAGGVAYDPVSDQTYFVVLGFSFILFLGALVGVRGRSRVQPSQLEWQVHIHGRQHQQRLWRAILVCAIISSLAIVPNFLFSLATYGWTGLFNDSYQVYLDREAGLGGAAPLSTLLPPFAYIGCVLAGVYFRRHGARLLLVFPIGLALLHALSFGGRNSLLIPAICLLAPNLVIPRELRRAGVGRAWVWLLAGAAVALFSFINASAERATVVGAYAADWLMSMTEQFDGVYKAYVYLTAPLSVLDQYLSEPFELFGVNTFFPLFSVLERLGVDVPVWRTLPSYQVPVQANVGTYLMELLIDFGMFGAIVVVALIGFAVGRCWRTLRERDSTPVGVGLTVLTLLLALSFFMWYGRTPNIWVLLLGGLIIGSWIDRATGVKISAQDRADV